MKTRFMYFGATILLALSVCAQDTPTPVVEGYVDRNGNFSKTLYPQPSANNNSAQQQPSGSSAAQIAAQQQAAEAAAAERKQQEEAQKAADQAKFNADKATALANLKGISSDDGLQLKSISSDNSFGLKGLDDSLASSGSKGLDDSGLKDAVADDSGDRKLFEDKNAIEDALTAKAHGAAGIEQLAGWLAGSGVNPEMQGALERAKAETNLRFDERTANIGQFDTVVVAGNPDTPGQAQSEALRVPEALKNDPRFQKLIIERDALLHQAKGTETKIQGIEADPGYKQDSKRLNQLDQLKITDSNLKGMVGYLNKTAADVAKGTITIDKVSFDETPAPQKHLDNIQVPSP